MVMEFPDNVVDVDSTEMNTSNWKTFTKVS